MENILFRDIKDIFWNDRPSYTDTRAIKLRKLRKRTMVEKIIDTYNDTSSYVSNYFLIPQEESKEQNKYDFPALCPVIIEAKNYSPLKIAKSVDTSPFSLLKV